MLCSFSNFTLVFRLYYSSFFASKFAQFSPFHTVRNIFFPLIISDIFNFSGSTKKLNGLLHATDKSMNEAVFVDPPPALHDRCIPSRRLNGP